MKSKAFRTSIMLSISLILASTLTLVFATFRAASDSITVDGDPSDWIGVPPATPNTGNYSGFEYIWVDEVGDDTGNGTYTYPTATPADGGPPTWEGCADLTELRITWDLDYVYFLLKFDNLTDAGWVAVSDNNGALPYPQWLSDPDQAETTAVTICIDTDRVSDSGIDFVDDGVGGISADILLPPEAYWEYLIEICLNDVILWYFDGFIINEAIRGGGPEGFTCASNTTLYETIEFAVPIDPYDPYVGLPDPTDAIWRFSVFTGVQDYEHFREVVGGPAQTWWGGGGADHPYDPDAYDAAFFATKDDQEAAFNGFTEWDYAVVSGYMDIDMSFIPIDRPPVADAGPDQTVDEDTLVTFDGSGSWDNVGIVNYTWTFVDITLQTLTGISPNYTFATPGVYVVTLNVTDKAGYWDTDTVIITVLDVTPPFIGIPSHDPLEPDKWVNVTISVYVTDEGIGVKNVTLSYTTNNGTSWTDLPMNFNETTVLYEAIIPGQPYCTWVKYKIIAYDNAGNKATKDKAGQLYVYHVIPEFPTWASTLLLLIMLTFAIAIYKRRLLKTPIH